jgi:hexosaminidase
MIKSTFLAMFCLLAMLGNSKQAFGQASAPMIPKPVEVKNFAGTFQLTAKSKVVVPAGNTEIEEIVQSFAGQLASIIGQKPEIVSRNQKQSIEFKINGLFNSRLGNEGYSLSVTPKMITISANKPAGLFYGAQTLLQMVPLAKTNAPILLACTEITDYPRFGWRGLMLDVSRHFFTTEEVKRFIDQMAKYKFNVFHWHLTDNQGWRIEIKGLPQLTKVGAWRVVRTGNFGYFAPPADGEQSTDGGFYTQDEVREIVKYAQERYVTIVPEIDVPGHSLAFIASYPEASCTQVQYLVNAGFPTGADVVLCAGNEDVFKKLETIFSEVASLFPGKYIHIGGDEADKAFWKKCPKCQERMKQENLKNEEELQSYFIKRVSKMLESNGKKLIGWDEILEGGLAPDAAVMSWRGTEGGAAAAKAGHPVVMTPNQYCYLDHTQGENVIERYGILFCCFMRMKEAYKFDPLTGVTDSAYVLGGQGNLWTEMVPNYRRAEYMIWPRALALSEVLWSPKANRDWDEFVPRVEAQLQRFDKTDVNYAPSMYDPDISMIKAGEDDYRIVFTPEIKGLDVYYTFDCAFPDHHSAKYDGQPVKTPKGASEIWEVTYRDGKPIGRLLVIKFDELKSRMGK